MNIDEIKKAIFIILENQGIYISNKDEDVNLLEYLVDSISIIEFIIALEDYFEIEIENEKISYEIFVSINGLCNLIKEIIDSKIDNKEGGVKNERKETL